MQSIRQHRQISAVIAHQDEDKPSPSHVSTEPTISGAAVTDSSERFCHDLEVYVNPKEWPFWTRLWATLLVTAISFSVQYASAVDSMVADKIQLEFQIGATEESLATGLFLIGLALGAPVAGPLSELVGRNAVYLVSYLAFIILTIGTALARNSASQLVLRFLAGMCGSSSLVCAGGTISDLWTAQEQIVIFPIYAMGGFMGFAVGPAAGGAIADNSNLDWRWSYWSSAILSGLVMMLVFLFQPETYTPLLLEWKDAAIILQARKQNHDLLRSEIPSRNSIRGTDSGSKAQKFHIKLLYAFYRPIALASEDFNIVLISIYLSLLYIVLFTFLPGYNFIFTETYGFTETERGASFMGLGVGFVLALLPVIPVNLVSKRDIEAGGNIRPKILLTYAMIGAPAVPISLFWMGWTTRESISPWSPIVASVLLGFGILCIFISSYQFIIHTHGKLAASGLVFLTLSRYTVAGGLILVGAPMYRALGTAKTLTVLGAIATILVPIPFYLYRFTVRRHGR